MSTMPVWGAVILAVGVALIGQVGAYILQSRGGKQEKKRLAEQHAHEVAVKRREEWHRNLRWAADHILEGSEAQLVLGVNALDVPPL